MVIGALGGALVMKFMPQAGSFGLFLCVLLASIIFGVIYSSLLAAACINLKADQTIVGTALNMLSTALATVLVKSMNLKASNGDNTSSVIRYENKQAFFSNLGSFELNWFMVVALIMLVVVFVLLYKTKFGLRLRACGEHPQAAASVGISVFKMRWAGVLLSGMLGGLGGITYITTGVSEWKFEEGVFGFGFLALAVMIFGAWNPLRIAGAALLFGFFRALGRVYVGIEFLNNLKIPPAVYNMLPYIVCLIVLAFTSKNSAAPKAEGIPYDKGMR